MEQILSYSINIILVIALIVVALLKDNKMSSQGVLSKEQLVIIYEVITDVIELGDIIADSYEEYKEKSFAEIFTNVISTIGISEDIKITNEIKLLILEKIEELLDDDEISEQLILKYEKSKELVMDTKNVDNDDNEQLAQINEEEPSLSTTDISRYL